jgi:hypothetical protein
MKRYGLHILVLGVGVVVLTVGLSVYLHARIAHVIFILLIITAIVQQVLARRSPCRKPTIQLDATGFSVRSGSGQLLGDVRWEEVESVIAFKRDRWTVDLICAVFDTSQGAFELNEECDGWPELMAATSSNLPGARPYDEAFHDIAFPPFKTNRTVLFTKAG